MDTTLFHFINTTLKNPVFDVLVPVFSDKNFVVLPGVVALVLLFRFGRRHARVCVAALVVALALSDLGSEKVIKEIFQQPRPYAALESCNLHRGEAWVVYQAAFSGADSRSSFGFPSSHASNMAAATVVLAFLFRRSLWLMIPMTLMVGFSRVYTGHHFPFQVVAGHLWGILAGFLAYRLVSWAVLRLWGPACVEAPREPLVRDRKIAYALLAGWTLFNLGYVHLNLFDLAGDEAQYWDWSRRLDLGYYSKPPMIAYFMDILTGAGGNKEWSLRTGALLLSSASLWILHALTLRTTRNERAALVAVVAAMAMPATFTGSVIMTIDPLLIFFWSLALLTFHRAVSGCRGMWLLTGVAIGLGLLSKYTAILLVPTFLIWILWKDRAWLRRPGPYLALAVALALQSGVLYWNWTHDWISFRHTASIGASESFHLGRGLGQMAEYLGSQAGLVSPLLFGLFLWAAWRGLRDARIDRDAAYLTLSFAVLFVFYLLVSITNHPQPNWPVAAYIGAAALFGRAWVSATPSRGMRKLVIAAVVLGCAVGLGIRSADLLYYTPIGREGGVYRIGGTKISDPANKLRGGRELRAAMARYAPEIKAGAFPFSERYQTTAWLAFYTPGRPRAYCLPADRRHNQYDLWGGWEELVGKTGYFVTGGDSDKAEAWIIGMVQKGLFASGEVLETVEVRRAGKVLKTFTICRLESYTGELFELEDRF